MTIFILVIVGVTLTFYLYWLPGYYQIVKSSYMNETTGKFNLLKLNAEHYFTNNSALNKINKPTLDQIISEQMDLYDDWVTVTIFTADGKIYLQQHKVNNEKINIFREGVYSKGELVGTIELEVAPAFYMKHEEQHINNLIFVIIGMLVLIFSIILLIQEIIIRKPLARLTDAADSIMQGKFDFNLPSSSRDEIGDLARSFVQMKASLVEANSKLQEGITLAKDIAEAFSKSEEQLSTIINNIADGLVIINARGIIEMYNPAFIKMLGYDEEEIRGKNINCIVAPEHASQHDSYVSDYLSGKAAKFVNQGVREIYAMAKDGQKIQIEITINDYIANSERYFVALLRDISERKEADQKLEAEHNRAQLYLDMAQVAIFSLNRDGHIILANKKSSEIFGFSQKELERKNWFDLIIESEIRDALREYYDLQMQEKDEMPAYFYLTMCNHNNEERILEWNNKVIKDKNGKPAGILCSGIDVTESQKSEVEKSQLRKQLLQSQKMEAIGQLTGGIAHDFNNILASIMGYTELLLEQESSDPKQKKVEYLNLIYESGERATELIQNMLTYSRGISAVKRHSLYLPGMVTDVMKMLASVIPSSVEIETDFDINAPDIACDSISIQQVIMNLCINARDAMNNKGVISLVVGDAEITNTTCASCGKRFDGHYVELCVSDNGPGINNADLSHLFEPFFSTKEVGKGSGMGLSVVHGILHETGAHILVDSEVGRGTVFKVYFPLADAIQDSNQNSRVA